MGYNFGVVLYLLCACLLMADAVARRDREPHHIFASTRGSLLCRLLAASIVRMSGFGRRERSKRRIM